MTGERPVAATPAPRQRAAACPICGKPSTAEAHPFCSKRCAHVDLNRWLSGTYVVPGSPAEDAAEDAEN